MKLKELHLDIAGLLAHVVQGHGYAHYGYWPDGPPKALTPLALSAAQQAYVDLLVSAVPEGTTSVLDVGSGTGAISESLKKLGIRPECLCPSERLNLLARERLGEDVPVHTLMFEEFNVDRQFDMCLFAESFHYIELTAALERSARYARKHVLIFDYFRRAPSGDPTGTRGTHAEFLQEVEKQGVFEVVRDDDLTEAILPTFLVTDHLTNETIMPFVKEVREGLAEEYRLYRWAEKLFLKKRLDRREKRSRRHETFPERHDYRLILMQVKTGG